MPHYRRLYQPGGCYFFTVNLLNRRSDLLVRRIEDLRHSFKTVRDRHPFDFQAVVILPDHLHCVMTLPMDDHDFSRRWRLIKSGFTRRVAGAGYRSRSRQRHGERGLWQRRFWEHLIRDEQDLHRHIDYIHYNPVKHGYVHSPKDWSYSSFHWFVEEGVLDENWSADQAIGQLDLR